MMEVFEEKGFSVTDVENQTALCLTLDHWLERYETPVLGETAF